MAGVVPTKRSTSGRKQWTLHDGPRSSLKRLRSQLASDGCPESQVVLAKQLLDEQSETESKNGENARLGVYWLIKASEQGNLEATHLLKTCFETGKGITEHNYMDVKSCITMTQDEKLARKAAREMFASLSNGGDFITSEQLQRKILAIDRDKDAKPPEPKCSSQENGNTMNAEVANNFDEDSDSGEETDWSLRSDSSNEKLTEDHLVAAAVNYSHGQLPIVNRILCLLDPNLKALDHVPVVHRSVLHPLLALKILYYKFLRYLGRQNVSSFLPIAKTEMQLLFLLLVYSIYSTEKVLYLFPMLIYYITLIIMFVTTCQMLQTKRDFLEFRLWSGLFICYSSGSINSEQAEYQYIRNNLKPYWQFFLALLCNLVIYPIISEQWIPHSELTIIAFCLTSMTLIGFMPKRRSKIQFDYLVFLSFGIHVLAKYPYETDPVVAQGWRFLDVKVPTFYTYVIGNGIEFCINFRMVLYTCIPLLFLRIASQNKWKGVYDILIPHCVTLSWLQICIVSSQGATMFGLLRGTLALVGLVLFLPLVGLTSITIPVLALTKWIVNSYTVTSLCLFIVLLALGISIVWLFAQTRYNQHIAFVQVFVAIIGFIVLINSSIPHDEFSIERPTKYLTWDIYQRFCHQPVWEDENVAIAQVKCAELRDVPIHWDGYISDIKVKSISNSWQRLFDELPACVRKYLYCLYGETTKSLCDNMPELVRQDCDSFYESIKVLNMCSLEKYNSYTLEVTVRMASGIWGKSPEVTLIASHVFYNYTMQLKPNDHIWFKGRLFNNEAVGPDGILGGLKPHIHLDQIGCVGCHNKRLTEYKLEKSNNIFDVRNVVNYIYLGLKFVLSVLLNPVIIFT